MASAKPSTSSGFRIVLIMVGIVALIAGPSAATWKFNQYQEHKRTLGNLPGFLKEMQGRVTYRIDKDPEYLQQVKLMVGGRSAIGVVGLIALGAAYFLTPSYKTRRY